MIIDEGGLPTRGSLSDYISEINFQKADATRQAALVLEKEKNRLLRRHLRRIAPLRDYLLELAKPLDELLERFKVRELFDEARDGFWTSGSIGRLEPNIYSIVSNPDPNMDQCVYFPTKLVEFDGNVHWKQEDALVETLLDPADLRRRIPVLQGYGLELTQRYNATVAGYKVESGGRSGWSGPNYWTTSTHSLVRTGRMVNVKVIKRMRVESIQAVSVDSNDGCDLLYSSYFKHIGNETEGWSPSGYGIYTEPIRILPSQSPDILKKLIGDQLVKQ